MTKIITLCGSTRFKSAFEEMERKLTLEGVIVLTVGFYEKIDGTVLSENQIELLNELHRKKIQMSDGIFVINKDGYIGTSTQSEIEFAKVLGKVVEYLE